MRATDVITVEDVRQEVELICEEEDVFFPHERLQVNIYERDDLHNATLIRCFFKDDHEKYMIDMSISHELLNTTQGQDLLANELERKVRDLDKSYIDSVAEERYYNGTVVSVIEETVSNPFDSDHTKFTAICPICRSRFDHCMDEDVANSSVAPKLMLYLIGECYDRCDCGDRRITERFK
jgi:hypothetical protein